MPENCKEEHSVKVVSFQIFVWAIGIVLLVFGISFSTIASLDKKVETSTIKVSGLEVDMREVKTNVVWIRQILEQNQAQISPKK